ANALEHLALLAKRTTTTLGGDSADAMAKLYAEGGYLADDGAMRALAYVKTAEDSAAVQQAVRCVYLPWLDATARHFEDCVRAKGGTPTGAADCFAPRGSRCSGRQSRVTRRPPTPAAGRSTASSTTSGTTSRRSWRRGSKISWNFYWSACRGCLRPAGSACAS